MCMRIYVSTHLLVDFSMQTRSIGVIIEARPRKGTDNWKPVTAVLSPLSDGAFPLGKEGKETRAKDMKSV